MELSKEQICILEVFYQENEIDTNLLSTFDINEKSNAFINLKKEGYLIDGKTAPYQGRGIIGCYAVSYQISEKGKAAYDRYCASIRSEQRESETLKLAKEANDIAKESNDISKEANKKSDKSNRIALGSLIAAIISVVVAVVAIVVSIA